MSILRMTLIEVKWTQWTYFEILSYDQWQDGRMTHGFGGLVIQDKRDINILKNKMLLTHFNYRCVDGVAIVFFT